MDCPAWSLLGFSRMHNFEVWLPVPFGRCDREVLGADSDVPSECATEVPDSCADFRGTAEGSDRPFPPQPQAARPWFTGTAAVPADKRQAGFYGEGGDGCGTTCIQPFGQSLTYG